MSRIHLGWAVPMLISAAILCGGPSAPLSTAAEPNQTQAQAQTPPQQATPTPPAPAVGMNPLKNPPPRSTLRTVTPEQVAEWRKTYGFESLAGRLNYEFARAPKSSPPLAKEVEQRLSAEPVAFQNMRGESLRQLHEDRAEEFISRSGFGVGRMDFMRPSPNYFNLP